MCNHPGDEQPKLEVTVSDSTTPLRYCTKCHNYFPATTEFFFYNKNANILFSWCKTCHGNLTAKTPRQWRTIPLPGFRWCRTCNTVYPLDAFPTDKE